MNFEMPKLSDAIFGGVFLGFVLLGLVVIFFLSAKAKRIRHEDISSISRRYQSYQDCARVPYSHGNLSQINRVDIINIIHRFSILIVDILFGCAFIFQILRMRMRQHPRLNYKTTFHIKRGTKCHLPLVTA